MRDAQFGDCWFLFTTSGKFPVWRSEDWNEEGGKKPEKQSEKTLPHLVLESADGKET